MAEPQADSVYAPGGEFGPPDIIVSTLQAANAQPPAQALTGGFRPLSGAQVTQARALTSPADVQAAPSQAPPLTFAQRARLMVLGYEADLARLRTEIAALREQVERNRDEALRRAEADLGALARLDAEIAGEGS